MRREAMSPDPVTQKALEGIDPRKPVLIAGPTASGKSRLALAAARITRGPVVNADAIQVFADWQVLTARPTDDEMASHPHALFGHVPGDRPYSAGQWLREVTPFLKGPPPVIVGGTGLNFEALTKGLAPIPETPPEVRAEADARVASEGVAALAAELDAETASGLDLRNPARVQRAWEVQRATGRGMAAWQADTPPPFLPEDQATRIVLTMPPEKLTPRIEARLDDMLAFGALDEARRNEPDWHPGLPSAKAIGASELIAHVRGEMRLDEARERIAVLTRQYAKRQRTFFRGRLRGWREIDA